MRKAAFIRSVQYNFTRAWTANAELFSGGSRSGLCRTSTSEGPAATAAEIQVLRGPSNQFGNDGKDFKSSSLVLSTSRASFIHTPITLFRHVDAFSRQYSSMPMASTDVGGIVEIELAQTGEGIADCELLRWFVQEGEEVEEFQPLCEVQSDKASVEITSRYKGRVSQVKFVPGDIIKVGETLLELIITGDNVSAASAGVPENHEPKELPSIESATSGHTKDIKTTPSIRHLAKRHGINLEDVPGTGEDGRILMSDFSKFSLAKGVLNEEMQVMEAVRGPDNTVVQSDSSDSDSEQEVQVSKEPKVFSTEDPIGDDFSVAVKPIPMDLSGSDKIIPVRGFRRIMAKTMTAAVAVPHLYYTEDINVDTLVKLKDRFKDVPLEQGVKLTYLPFLLKALSIALQKYPLMNSTVNQDVSEITVKASHNIGIGMATSCGLVVPNIKNVQQLSVVEIATDLARLTQLAATNRLRNEDVTGGTITVSNFGSIGGKYGSPVLNVPEVAIVAIGRMQKLPRFAEDGILYPANIMGVTWGADHRVIDGATVASFCNQWKMIIEQPERFLLNMR